jgi:hypothetical protein
MGRKLANNGPSLNKLAPVNDLEAAEKGPTFFISRFDAGEQDGHGLLLAGGGDFGLAAP